MARGPSSPVFLERRSYRRRRLQDAQRLLPVLGMLLWMVPVLWPTRDETGHVTMSAAIYYVFGVWCLLIGLSFGLWRGLKRKVDEGTEPPAGDP
ncbi:hypothetical protein [Pseudosulfitobacter pseudonitzschiae]|uniref:Uncharacterized protein n=1 Tax=Pseudosulfitobacter pseudonitzschiae TaxID=1402135 RepID=A0A073J118_9RHOB|nr:hypothetical protein [Pseudosulfitobacter pseudonitzschiae]KEJ95689.1 hypothetical protein SUH3_19450 [Pseudosulfitobacter pseudonitzschiae]MBM1813611.1 hypothetical protein [Pseudosulfitobacter pseudonitzschiae]MBM1830604.1 hypothetical protein [Pseudosulfitobacter pseudonitzschiae]MBM1835471.1 hypothetical protein [Pseudosulfitobacter pseudonitzschiae]MBM1840317.1 hypothetical protein [Pseudosulfitobacter pseudonitzschiae]